MKLALLLPGYLDSPDYLHMKVIKTRLKAMNYTVEALDPCNLWKTGLVENYTITNYLSHIKQTIEKYASKNPKEIILIGHSLGGFVAIIAGIMFPQVSKTVALCPPSRAASTIQWQLGKPRHSKRDLPEDPTRFKEFDIPYTFFEDALQYSALNAVSILEKPLMIFIAMQDTVVPPEQTETLVQHTLKPHVVRFPNIGHDFRHSITETEQVMDEIEKFLIRARN